VEIEQEVERLVQAELARRTDPKAASAPDNPAGAKE
jgi:hypothetical protein